MGGRIAPESVAGIKRNMHFGLVALQFEDGGAGFSQENPVTRS
jgi:hypothetical protein